MDWTPAHLPALRRFIFGCAVCAASLALVPRAHAQLWITEFEARNDSGFLDEDGRASDWLEIHNGGATPVDLNGWGLTDDAADPLRWAFPAVAIGPGEYRVVFCSGEDRRVPGQPLHTNFKLDGDGEFLALVRPDGVTIEHGFAPAYPPQVVDYSYGLASMGGAPDPATLVFFESPTPGATNGPGAIGFADEPVFSEPSRTFFGDLALELTVPGAGEIRYTLDGTRPELGDPLYSGPIVIDESMTVTARTFTAGLYPSLESQRTLVALDDDLVGFSSNLPLLFFDTDGSSIPSYDFVDARFCIRDGSAALRATTGSAADAAGTGGLKQRGSSSAGFAKKQYAFETWDAFGEDLDVSILGFPADSDWILNGPYSDKSLMRNALSYLWSNRVDRWAPGTRFCEVFINTGSGRVSAADYVGVYVFMEKIKRGEDRVDIEEIEPADDALPELSGGYIFKKDRLDPGDDGFSVPGSGDLAFVEPKEDEITPVQTDYLRQLLLDLDAALAGPDPANPISGYPAIIDVDAWIDHYWVVELTKNIDGFRLSSFFHKDRGGKLAAGPVWDYNLSLGNANYLQGWQPEGWYHALIGGSDYPWWDDLFDDPDFAQRAIDRWVEHRRGVWSTPSLLADVEAMRLELEEAQARNFARWDILGSYVWPNWFVADTWDEELDFMESFIVERAAWIDAQSLAPPVLAPSPGEVAAGTLVALSAPTGLTIYYTIDGTDPRWPGGAVSPAATGISADGVSTTVLPGAGNGVRAWVATSGVHGDAWRQPGFDDSSWSSATGVGVGYDQQPDYDPWIDLDVEGAMSGVATGIYLRYEFWVDDPAVVTGGVLSLRYDDGFAAWVNGVFVASDRAPDPLVWDSSATSSHPDTEATTPVEFGLPPAARAALVPGWNVLAIHGLNVNPTSSDFLIVPELTLSSPSALGVAIAGPTFIRARTHDGTAWSGLTEGTYVTPGSGLPIRVREFLYHPPPAPAGSPYEDDDYEFIELVNISSSPISLVGLAFDEGVEFDFGAGTITTLGGGGTIVVVKNRDAFESRYGPTSTLTGEYSGSLSNGGETLRLAFGPTEVLSFTYDDAWYPSTDGGGHSLVTDALVAAPVWWSTSLHWRPSAVAGGTPGYSEGANERRPGDVNGDGGMNIADVLVLLAYLFGSPGGALPCGGATPTASDLLLVDLNTDGAIDLADVLFMLSTLFQGGPPPALGLDCIEVDSCPSACP